MIKKILCYVLCLIVSFLFTGCGDKSTESLNLSQEVTIVKMPSPPKCKTTNDISVVNELLSVLGEMEKIPIDSDVHYGGWYIMVKLKIDSQRLNYTIGSIFTDADGRRYSVSNYKEIENKLTKIYNELDVPEVDYP